MKRYGATGQLPVNMRSIQPVFADVSGYGDYADALRRITAAKESFAALPAELRGRFGNSAERLVSFLQDTNNRDEAIKLGLIPAPEPAVSPKEVPPTAA